MSLPGPTSSTTGQSGYFIRWHESPRDLGELSERARALAGLTLGELARSSGADVPDDLRRAKGWVGTLVERALGASAGSRAEPDFPHLGVELKTLPVDAHGEPLESTFVCSIELSAIADSEWEQSRLYKKLSHVLWVPIEGTRSLAVRDRRIATPLLWQPDPGEKAAIRRDWEALALLIAQGQTDQISGHLGDVLQVRPKARRGASRRLAVDDEGALYDEQPKGFYLRPKFTRAILHRHFAIMK